jgi:lipopolysaccharide export LptBFGC system permease protein LptF
METGIRGIKRRMRDSIGSSIEASIVSNRAKRLAIRSRKRNSSAKTAIAHIVPTMMKIGEPDGFPSETKAPIADELNSKVARKKNVPVKAEVVLATYFIIGELNLPNRIHSESASKPNETFKYRIVHRIASPFVCKLRFILMADSL